MPTYDGLAINIRVDGEYLPEFTVEEDKTTKTISCWVPSQIGKEFAVMVQDSRPRNNWKAVVEADGVFASSWLFQNLNYGNIGFFPQSETAKRPFMFSKIELVDDDDILCSSLASKVGQIEVKCNYVELGAQTVYSGNIKTLDDNKKMHEKSKKGITEHIGLGKEMPRNTCGFSTKDLEHIVTYIFHYRPLDYLRAQDIAPRDPPPEPLPPFVNAPQGRRASRSSEEGNIEVVVKEESSPLEDEDNDEIQTLLAKLDEARVRQRKRTRCDGPERKNKKPKKEERPVFVPGEVIDLT